MNAAPGKRTAIGNARKIQNCSLVSFLMEILFLTLVRLQKTFRSISIATCPGIPVIAFFMPQQICLANVYLQIVFITHTWYLLELKKNS